MKLVVTIDGPSGAGKSTVARHVAEALGWRFLDTGAMYRAVALAATRHGFDTPKDATRLADLAKSLQVELAPEGVTLNGEDVTEAIRHPEITSATWIAAGNPGVREVLVDWQRRYACIYDIVTEGRDQGTIVFPKALKKFFLTASEEERAHRRHAELVAKGSRLSFDQVLLDQRRRDAADESREIAPLRPAEDAVIIDTTTMTLPDVVHQIVAEVRRALRGSSSGPFSSSG